MKNSKIKNRRKAGKKLGLLGFLFALAESIARIFKKSPLGFLFADLYTLCNQKWKNGLIYNVLKKKKQKIRSRATLAHIYEQSFTSKVFSDLSHDILHSNLRIWGVALLFFAFSVISTTMIKYYFLSNENNMVTNFIVGITIFVISLPLIISKKEFGEALISGKLTRFVITNVLNLNPTMFERSTVPFEGSYIAAILCSITIGMCTYFQDSIIIVQVAILFALFVLIMSFPELGVASMIIMLPFSSIFNPENPSMVVLIFIGFTTLGFLIKFFRGKRVMRFELIDVFVLAFAALVLFGGVFSYGGAESLASALVYFAFLCVYFLISNMYISKPSIYRAFKMLIVTATLVSIFGIIHKGVFDEGWVDISKFGDGFAERASVFFNNPNTLASYLLLIFPIVLGQFAVSRKTISKVMYFISAAFIVACLIKTGSRGSWVGLIVSFVIFLLLYNFKNIWIVLLCGATVPLWNQFLPLEFSNRFMSSFDFTAFDSSINTRINTWETIVPMIKDHFITGIGIGEDVFHKIYGRYAPEQAEKVVHSHDVFLQILIGLGIIGLVVFVAIIFMYGQKCFVEIKTKSKKSRSRAMIIACFSSIVGALVMGLVDEIWYNYRVFLVFWIVIALSVSIAKINVKDRESTKITQNMTSASIEIDG